MRLPKTRQQPVTEDVPNISEEEFQTLLENDALRGGVSSALRRLFMIQAPQHVDSLFIHVRNARCHAAVNTLLPELARKNKAQKLGPDTALRNGASIVIGAMNSVKYEGFCRLLFRVSESRTDVSARTCGGVLSPTLAAAFGENGVLKEMVWMPDPNLCKSIDKDLNEIFVEFGELEDWHTGVPSAVGPRTLVRRQPRTRRRAGAGG